MAAGFLSVLCVLLAVTGSFAAHQVSFNNGRTFPQEARDVQNEVERECDDACMERREQELFPMLRRFLSSLNEKVDHSSDTQDQAALETPSRSIADVMEEAKRKRALDIFGRNVDRLREVERGVVKGGLHAGHDHEHDHEHNRSVNGAGYALKRTVEEQVDRNRKQADMVRQVRALINDLEERSQAQSKQAERFSQRAVQDLNAAMALETRAEHMREVLEHNQQERALHTVNAIKRSAAMVGNTQEEVKRGMRDVKELTEQLQRRKTEKRDARRNELFGELNHLVSRAIQEKITMLAKRELEDEEKRTMTAMSAAQQMANGKRALEKGEYEEARELVGMKIAKEIAQTKRTLEEVRSQKARELTGMKIAEQVAEVKRALEKRKFEEAREVMGMKVATEVSAARRALEERKFEEAGEFTGLKVAAQMAEAKRAVDKGKFEEAREIMGMKVAAGVADAKRALEKRKIEEARENMGLNAAAQIAEAKRMVDKRNFLKERKLAEERFSEKLDALKRTVDESKARRALKMLETYQRAIKEGEQHEAARRALEGLKATVEKRASRRDADLEELEALISVEGAEAKIDKGSVKRDTDLAELEAVVGVEGAEATIEKGANRRDADLAEMEALVAVEGAEAAEQKVLG